MTKQTSIKVFLKSLGFTEELTGEQMSQLIRDLEQLRNEVREPRYKNAIEQAIDFLRLQIDLLERNNQLLRQSLSQYSDKDLLRTRWQSINRPPELAKSVWQDLKSITAASYQLEEIDLINCHASELLEQLNYYIDEITNNSQAYIQDFLVYFEESCDGRIEALKQSDDLEDEDFAKYYLHLKKIIDMTLNPSY